MPIVLKSGSLKLLETSGPVQACNGDCFTFLNVRFHIFFTGLDDPVLGSRRGQEIFLFSETSRPTLRPTQPFVQCVKKVLPVGLRWSGREVDNINSFSDGPKN